MAIALQFLCVIVPLQRILDLKNQGAFAPAHPLLEKLAAPDQPAEGGVDWLAEPDATEIALRFKQKWSRRAFRAEGGYFAGGMGTEWYDGRLYCNTFMHSVNADDEIDAWLAMGLTPLTRSAGARTLEDLCVAASRRGPTNPCAWLEYDKERNCAWLRGHAPGRVFGGSDNYQAWLEMSTGGLCDADT
jgi:hypothetical protein